MIHRTPEEKMEIIHLVEHSDLSITKTCAELDVARSTFSRRTPGRCIGGIAAIRRKASRV